jgi:AAHS family 4-hydroxybenzoate transporter-like MFS transporter
MTMHSEVAPQDPRSILLSSNMSFYQIGAVAITLSLCALDGFDVLAITFAAPGILKEWGTSKSALGVVFSAGLIGMAFGSLFVSPLADLVGRRKIILLCLAVMAFGMFLTATANSVSVLAAWRVVTGMGIGGMISVIYPLAAEYANARRRDLAVGITAVGYGIGGVIGGLVVAGLLRHFDWRSIFIFGGGVALAMAPIVYLRLPESVPFLIALGRPNALEQINAFLARCGLPQVLALPLREKKARPARRSDIFAPGMLRTTLTIAVGNLLFVLSFYYLLSWLPQMVAELGFSASQAAQVSVVTNLGGVLGGTALGWASSRFGLKRLLLLSLCAAACMITLFGRTPASLPLLIGAAALAGIFLFGSAVGIFAVVARSFPAHLRATGTGFVVGVARVSSAAAPAIAGFMLAAGISRGEVALFMSLPAVLTAIIFSTLTIREISTEND